MKIEAGKYYVTRGGDVVGPMVYVDVPHQYKWIKDKDDGWWNAYTDDGFYVSELNQHHNDLIKEHVMPKFKVGDRVRYAGGWGGVVIEVCELVSEMVKIERDGGGVELTHANNVSLVSSAPAPLDLTKPVQTRDGRKVRLLCTDGPGSNWPVIGIVEGCLFTSQWPLDGKLSPGDLRDSDLINTPAAPRTFERWFNVYDTGDITDHLDRRDADDEIPWQTRIARKRVVFTEGEWDE